MASAEAKVYAKSTDSSTIPHLKRQLANEINTPYLIKLHVYFSINFQVQIIDLKNSVLK